MTAPVLELHIKASGIQDVNALTAALTALDSATGRLSAAKANLSSLDQVSRHLQELRTELKAGFAGLSQVMADGMKGAFSAADTAAKQGGAAMAGTFDTQMKKIAADIAKSNEEIARKLTAANGKLASEAGAAGKKVGKEFAEGVQSEVAKVRVAAKGVSLGDGLSASASASGLGSAEAVRKAVADIKANAAAVAAAEADGRAKIAAARGRAATRMSLDDTRSLLGMPSRDEMKTFAASLQGQMQADLRTAGMRAKSATRMGLDDTRALLGMPSRDEMKTFAASLQGQMQAELQTAGLRARSATRMGLDDTRALLGMPSRDEMKTFAASLQGQMQAEMKTAGLRARGATKMSLDDTRALLGMPSRSEMKSFAAVLQAEMNETVRAQRMVNAATSRPAGVYSSTSVGSMGELRNVPKILEEVTQKTPKAASSLKEMAYQMHNAHGAARGLASGFGALWLTWGAVLPLLAGAAVSNGFVQVIKLGAEVQNTFTAIRVLAGESVESVAGLNQKMMELGRNGPFGPAQLSAAMKTLALAGLDAQKVYQALPDVLNFAVAGDTDIKQAADVMTTVATAFNISAKSYAYVGDTIAKAAAESKSSVESMGEAFKTASVIHQQYGVSLEDTAIGLALVANAGIQGTAAGTALRNMYADLAGRTPKVTKAMKELGVEGIDPATGKMREQAKIFNDLMKALAQRTPTAQFKYIQDIFSERGGKEAIAIMNALKKTADETGQAVGSVYDQLAEKIANAAGFTAIAAAEMSLTPLNQMRSVAASLQTTLVEVFSSLQPVILDMTTQLKELFQSEDFKSSLRDMVTLVGTLTVALFENGRTILSVILAYSGIRAVVGIMTTVSAATVAWGAATSGAVTAVGLATRAASLANPVLAVLMGLVTIGTVGWAAYQMWVGKSSDATDKFAGNSNSKALLDKLREERDRLVKVNEARSKGISLMELEAQTAMALARSSLSTRQASTRNALATFDAANPSINAPATSKEALLLLNRKKEERARLAGDVLAADRAQDRHLVEATQLSSEISGLQKVAADGERQRMKDEQKNNPSGSIGAPVKIPKTGKGPRGIGYDNDRSTIEADLRTRQSVLKNSYENEQSLLDNKHRNQLISEGTYQATLLQQAEEYDARVRAAINEAQQLQATEYAERVAKAKKELKGENLDQALDNLKNKYIQFSTATQGSLEKIDSDAKLRREKAVDNEAGALLKMTKANDDYWEKAKAGAAKEAAVLKSRLALADASEEVRARREAEIKVEESATLQMDKLSEEYNKAQKALEGFLVTNGGVIPNSEAAIAQYEAMQARVLGVAAAINTAKTATDQLKQSAGDTAVSDVQSKLLVDTRKSAIELSKVVSGKLADAILEGGKDGGKALKDWFKDYFIRQPIKVLLQASMQGVGNMVAQMAYPGAGQLPMGGMGGGVGLLGSAGSIYSGVSSLGAAFMGGYSGVAGLGAATTAMGATSTMSAVGAGTMLATDAMGATVISGAAGATGAGGIMAGMSTALAAIPVWGWAALAVAAIASFASKGGGPKTEAGYAPNGMNIAGTDIGGRQQGSQRGDVAAARGISQGIGASYAGLAATFGLTKKELEVGIFYAMDNHEGGDSLTQLQVSSANYNRGTRTGGIENVARGEDALKKELASEALRVLISELRANVGGKYAEYLDKVDLNAEDDILQKALNTVTSVKVFSDAMENLPFNRLADLSVEAAMALGEMAGSLENLTANLSTYYQNFYSPEERRQQTGSNIQRVLSEAGGTWNTDQLLGMNRNDFRALVDAASLRTDEEGKKLYIALLSVAGAFASITEAAGGMADTLSNKLSDALEGVNKAVSAQKTLIDAQFDILSLSLNTQIDSQREDLSKIQALSDLLHSTLSTAATGPLGMSRATASRQIRDANTVANATGVLPDVDAIRDALSVASNASTDGFSSYIDYVRAYDKEIAQISELSKLTDDQLTNEQRILKALEDQLELATAQHDAEIKRLDDVLANAQALVDEANGINTSVLSVADAVDRLYALLGGKKSPSTTSSSSSASSGTSSNFTTGAGAGASGAGGGVGAQIAWNEFQEYFSVYGSGESGPMRMEQYLKYYGETQNSAAAALKLDIGTVQAYFARAGIPAFEKGGYHSGGWALVGEKGPELMYSGPSMVYNSADSERMLGGYSSMGGTEEVVRAINVMAYEQREIGLKALTQHGRMLQIFEKWDDEGQPATRT